MEDVVKLIFAIVAVILGLIFGRRRERAHYRDIIEREKRLMYIPVRADGRFHTDAKDALMVMGNVVIANDRFKELVGTLQSFFGGKLSSFESLLDRGRREAVLRLKEKAEQWGASEIIHLRVDSVMLDGEGVELFATATALK